MKIIYETFIPKVNYHSFANQYFGFAETSKKCIQVDIPFVVVVVDNRQMGEDKYLSRQPGLRQM